MEPIQVDEILGNYQILKTEIAKGGNGIIHLAKDLHTGQKCAVKVLNRNLFLEHFRNTSQQTKSDEELETLFQKTALKFRHEFYKVLGLKHPNLAQTLDLGSYKGHFYIVSEFVEGKDLFQTLVVRKVKETIPVFMQILEGLEFIHRHDLLHLDIKPENVLVTTNGSQLHPKLIDFGSALTIGNFKFKPRGTPAFMPPEVILSQVDKVDARSDLYSFGAVMYYCLTGELPFKNRNKYQGKIEALIPLISDEALPPPLTDYNESVPDFLNTIVLRLLSKNPEDRVYSNPRAVINALLTQSPNAFLTKSKVPSNYLAPERDQHVGRADIQDQLNAQLMELSQGKVSKKPVISIVGETGMGKTHLLKTIKNQARSFPEKILLHHLELPSHEEWLSRWAEEIHCNLIEGKKPVLILIDNLDHAVKNTAENLPVYSFLLAIGRLLRESSLKRPFLLCFTSTEYPLPHFPIEASTMEHMELKAFSLEEVREYVMNIPALSNTVVPMEWLKSLHIKTAGIPLEIRAQLEQMNTRGLLFDPNGKILFSELQEPDLESSLIFHGGTQTTNERILSEFNRLTDIEKRIIKWFAAWTWLGLAPSPKFDDLFHFFPTITLAQTLLNLVDYQILTYNEESKIFAFSNPFASSVIYPLIPIEERRQYHDALGEYFEGKNSESKSLHLGFGSDLQQAIYHLIRLGKSKRDKGHLIVAQTLLNKALELVSAQCPKLRACVLSLLMANYHHQGKYSEAENCFQEALSLLETNVAKGNRLWKITLYEKIVPVYLEKGKRKEALVLIQEGLKLCDNNTIMLHYILLKNYEATYYYLESFEEGEQGTSLLKKAEAVYLETLVLEEKLHSSLAGIIQNNDLGRVLRSQGKYAEAIEILLSRLRSIKDKNRVYERIMAHLTLAECYLFLKNQKEAKHHAEEALAVARKTGQGKWFMHARMTLANIYYDVNEFESALEEDRSALVASAFLENEKEHAKKIKSLMIRQGHYLKELGQWDEALAHFESALEAKATGWHRVQALEGLGEIYFYKKEYEKALKFLAETHALLKDMPEALSRPHRFRVEITKAIILCEKGLQEKAKKMLPTLKLLAAKDPQLIKECTLLEKKL